MASKKMEEVNRMIDEKRYSLEEIVHSEEIRNQNDISVDFLIDLLVVRAEKKLLQTIIESREIREKLQFNASRLSRLICALESPEYIQKLLQDKSFRKKLDLLPSDVVEIAITFHDASVIESFLENQKVRRDYHLRPDTICDLVLATNDKDYIERVLEDETFAKKIGMDFIARDITSKLDFIMATHDVEYIRKFFEEPQRIEEMDMKYLSGTSILNLILASRDASFMKSFLEDEKKAETFHLEYYDKLCLLAETKDKEYIQAYLDRLAKELHLEVDETLSFKLPPELTIGVELESENTLLTRRLLLGLGGIIGENYTCEVDMSLPLGMEVQTPIMHGGSKEDVQELLTVCNRLKCFGQKMTPSCGGHIHFGADFLSTEEEVKAFSELWLNTEKLLFLISNAEGDIPRAGAYEYAMPVSGIYEELVSNDGTVAIHSDEDLVHFMQKKQDAKHFSVNYSNIGNQEKNTYEIRIPNGAFGKTLVENINLFGGMMVAAKELAQIMTHESKTEEEERKLSLFEKIKQSGISEEEKLQCLLKLAIGEEDREIYERRYTANLKALEAYPELTQLIDKKISKRPIVFSKNASNPSDKKNKEDYEER